MRKSRYCWKKLDGSKEEMQEEVKAAEPKAVQTRAILKVKQAPVKQSFPNLEEQSPRSTDSGDTAELTAADMNAFKHMNAGETAEMKAAGFGVTAGPMDAKRYVWTSSKLARIVYDLCDFRLSQ